jgi:hypothetical protein
MCFCLPNITNLIYNEKLREMDPALSQMNPGPSQMDPAPNQMDPAPSQMDPVSSQNTVGLCKQITLLILYYGGK